MTSSLFTKEFFIENRYALLQQLATDDNYIVMLQSASQMVKSNDQYYQWRQDPNFYYLTGIDAPNCFLLIFPEKSKKDQSILFIPRVDPEIERWDGTMLTQEKASELSGISNVQFSDFFLKTLYREQRYQDILYCQVNDVFPHQPLTSQHLLIKDLRDRLPGLQFKSILPIITKLRSIKKPVELKAIQNAIDVTTYALKQIKNILRPGIKEYEIEAELTYHYLKNGCKRLAFEHVIASGKNATILHYNQNNNQIQENELLLIDTGAEYEMYSSDISRVFPASGKFLDRQKQCYEAVLQIQKEIISQLKTNMTYNELYYMADEIQGRILTEAGLIKNPTEHHSLTLHKVGHYLGLDVHDPGKLDWPLQTGTVITIEPGLYLREEGIGIRIEDDILFTNQGVEVLSCKIPKEIKDLEK